MVQSNSAILSLLKTVENAKSTELWLYGDEIIQLSTWYADDFDNLRKSLTVLSSTTALSAIPIHHPRRFLALEAARECLRVCRHIGKKYSHNVYNWTLFCHWILLRVPLTPFTGVFYNIIANPETSQGDLELLQDYASSLKDASRLSETIDRFSHLCSVFVKVAQSYVRAKTQCSDSISALPSDLGDFGEQLLALGLSRSQPPMAAPESHLGRGTTDSSKSNMGVAQNAQLDFQGDLDLESFLDWDWYSSNVSAYGIMDQDSDILNGSGFADWIDPTERIAEP